MRHQHRQPGALTLAAGEAVHQARGQRFQPDLRDRLFDPNAILVTEAAQRAVPRIAAYRHQLAHRHAFCGGQLLRQVGDFTREGFAVPRLDRRRVEQHAPLAGALVPSQHFQQGGFAGAVMADKRGHFARRKG